MVRRGSLTYLAPCEIRFFKKSMILKYLICEMMHKDNGRKTPHGSWVNCLSQQQNKSNLIGLEMMNDIK
jgi:hypothetical protein